MDAKVLAKLQKFLGFQIAQASPVEAEHSAPASAAVKELAQMPEIKPILEAKDKHFTAKAGKKLMPRPYKHVNKLKKGAATAEDLLKMAVAKKNILNSLNIQQK